MNMFSGLKGEGMRNAVREMEEALSSAMVPLGTPDPKGDEPEELTANRSILEQEEAFDNLHRNSRILVMARPGMLRRAGQDLRYVLREMKLGFFNFWK